jgi:hypothetical protein
LGLAPRSLLVSLVVLTGAAWALSLYHTLSMSMPTGIVVRGGMAAERLGGMAMGGMSGAGWSLGGKWRHLDALDRLIDTLCIGLEPPHPRISGPTHGRLTSMVATSRSGLRRSGSPWTTEVSAPTVS